MSEELKLCPFCGGKTTVKQYDGYKGLVCEKKPCLGSGLMFAMFNNEKEFAIKAWNNRPIEDELRQENERLRALTEWKPIEEFKPTKGTFLSIQVGCIEDGKDYYESTSEAIKVYCDFYEDNKYFFVDDLGFQFDERGINIRNKKDTIEDCIYLDILRIKYLMPLPTAPQIEEK